MPLSQEERHWLVFSQCGPSPQFVTMTLLTSVCCPLSSVSLLLIPDPCLTLILPVLCGSQFGLHAPSPPPHHGCYDEPLWFSVSWPATSPSWLRHLMDWGKRGQPKVQGGDPDKATSIELPLGPKTVLWTSTCQFLFSFCCMQARSGLIQGFTALPTASGLSHN